MSSFVTPSELINLYFYAAKPAEGQLLEAAIIITNAMQTANFSFNFVLYLAVNAQFRGAVAEASRCGSTWCGPASTCCCRPPLTAAAGTRGGGITLETVMPTPLQRPSPAVTSTAAVNAQTTPPSHEAQIISAVVEQRVSLRRHRRDDDNDDDDDGQQPVDDC